MAIWNQPISRQSQRNCKTRTVWRKRTEQCSVLVMEADQQMKTYRDEMSQQAHALRDLEARAQTQLGNVYMEFVESRAKVSELQAECRSFSNEARK